MIKIKKIVLLLIFSLFIISCEQKFSTDDLPKSIGNVPIISCNYSVNELALNSEDKYDEQINNELIKSSSLLKDLLLEKKYSKLISNEIKLNGYLKLNTLTESVSELKESIIARKLSNIRLGQNSDLILKSTSIDEPYIPEILCPNYEIADFNKEPIFCYGFEVNAYLEGLEEYDDFIPAWYETENGETLEFLIDETTALNSINPVYILCNGTLDSEIQSNNTDSNFSAVRLKSASAISSYFNITSMQVNHRYDRSKNSEIYIHAAMYSDKGYWVPILHATSHSSQKIRDVNKGDIGKTLSANRSICVKEPEPFASNYLYFNIFERDWYSSSKSLGSITINGETAYLSGKRKYSNEWYAFDPATISNHPINLQSAYNNGYIWISNSKGSFKISKIYE